MRRRERTCRLCGTPHDLTRHHVIPQGLGAFSMIPRNRMYVPKRALNDPRNIVPLCRLHHDAIDEHRILRGLLRDCLTERELMYIRATVGPAWLDEHYPPTNGGHHGQEH